MKFKCDFCKKWFGPLDEDDLGSILECQADCGETICPACLPDQVLGVLTRLGVKSGGMIPS